MKICVLGQWHLGSVTSACLASLGHQVVGLDENVEVINSLSSGEAPIYEPGLNELLSNGLENKSLRFTANFDDALSDVEFLWVAIDTPVDEDDRADIDMVYQVIEKSIAFLPTNTMVIVSSQLPVGSIQKIENYCALNFPDKQINFTCIPENLRLGNALEVFLRPDRLIVGCRNRDNNKQLEALISTITNRVEWVSVESAEMIKHAINSFLAMSISYANEIASLCEYVGADAKEVERGLKTDQRIGVKSYVAPGTAFAGGTLARDIDFLGKAGADLGVSIPLLNAIKHSNDGHKKWVQRKILENFPSLKNLTISVWGITYKPGTDTLRRSLAVEMIDWLVTQGSSIKVYDPIVKDLPSRWLGKVQLFLNPTDSVLDSKALLIYAEWPQFIGDVLEVNQLISKPFVVIDPKRHIVNSIKNPLIKYIAVGRGAIT